MSGFNAAISLSISDSVITVLQVALKAFPPGVPGGQTRSMVTAAFDPVVAGAELDDGLAGAGDFFAVGGLVWAVATVSRIAIEQSVETKPRTWSLPDFRNAPRCNTDWGTGAGAEES
jgi:hypothetical protein